jgi:protein ImuB
MVAVSILRDEEGPIHIRGGDVRGKILNLRGPYLISGNWWDEKSWARSEWDLQLDAGELFRCHQSDGAWKIDGIYD